MKGAKHRDAAWNRRPGLPTTVGICALGTGCGSPNAPTPAPSPRLPPPPAMVAVGTGAHVIDVNSGHSIAGANVTAVKVCYREPAGGRCRSIDQPARATADENGVFLLAVSLPLTWQELRLEAARAGYETGTRVMSPSAAMDAVLEVYPTLTIRPGELIKTRLSWEARRVAGCRRIAAAWSSSRLQVNQSTSK